MDVDVCVFVVVYVSVSVCVWGRGGEIEASESRNNVRSKQLQFNSSYIA